MTDQKAIVPFEETMSIARAMAASGYFSDASDANKAIVKILAGQEFGFGPVASMMGIYVIQGRPTLSANLIAAKIKNDPRYDYRVVEMTDKNCSIDFFEGSQKIGNSTFSLQDAQRAGTKNLDKFPRNMLFARAISNGARWYTPGIFGGAPVYTPEELGAEIDQEGNVIPGTFRDATPPPVVQQPSAEISLESAQELTNKEGVKYGDLPTEKLSFMFGELEKGINEGKYHNGKLEEAKLKRDAITVIMNARNTLLASSAKS